MAAGKVNLPSIEKGATYRHTLYWKDSLGVAINMTGCTGKMQVRESVDKETVEAVGFGIAAVVALVNQVLTTITSTKVGRKAP